MAEQKNLALDQPFADLCLNSLSWLRVEATVIIPIVQMRKLKHREVEGVAQGHTASKLLNTPAGGVTLMVRWGGGGGGVVQSSKQKPPSLLSQPSHSSPTKHHPSPLNSLGLWEVNCSRYHYPHFIDE